MPAKALDVRATFAQMADGLSLLDALKRGAQAEFGEVKRGADGCFATRQRAEAADAHEAMAAGDRRA